MSEVWVPIIVAIIGSGLLTGLAKSLWDQWKNKNKEEDNAWLQRDVHRHRADLLHEALMTHRTYCHKHHGMAWKDMPRFPGREKRDTKDA